MKIGEKIRQRRKELGYTQAYVCGDGLTRNMLSLIETDKANPSLQTLCRIARILDVPVSYLIGEEDLDRYRRSQTVPKIRAYFKAARYDRCLSEIDALSQDGDDELNWLGAQAALALAKSQVRGGSFSLALGNFDRAAAFAARTVYPVEDIRAQILLYRPVAENFRFPLLSFDQKQYERTISDVAGYEFYKYMTMDGSYFFQNPLYEMHLRAKRLMRLKKYAEAIELLSKLEDRKNEENAEAYLLFGVYADLETCYKEIGDFERAYRYANKRISFIDALKR